MKITNKEIYLLGDTHGRMGIVQRIADILPKGSAIIQVGDFGVGFRDVNTYLTGVSKILKRNDMSMYVVRGNHDDSKCFDDQLSVGNVKLLKDYSVLDWNGKSILCIGGAISVDRIKLLPGLSWWEGEEVVYDANKIVECDVLITHAAPSSIGPTDEAGIRRWTEHDDTLWEELQDERRVLNKILKETNPKRHFCGHYHTSEVSGISRILDINEIYKLRLGTLV